MNSSDVQPVLEASAVSVVFNAEQSEEVIAVRDVSFSLRKGEVLAVVGPSGCGKSTLFNVIAGLVTPTEGAVEVKGKRVDRAAGQVGYMLQKDLLLPWRTVFQNVLLGLEVRGVVNQAARERAAKLIRQYGLGGFEAMKPDALSGGMRQRVAFMRTLALEPDVILLDEPFSALDFQTRLALQVDVLNIIRERGASVILITHDIHEAITMADRIIVMTKRPGSILSTYDVELSPEERDPVVVRSRPVYIELFGKLWKDLDITRELRPQPT